MTGPGQPLKFKSVKQLEKKIQDYFNSCFEEKWFDQPKRDKNGKKMIRVGKRGEVHEIEIHIKKLVQIDPITITGLAVALDTNRQTLLNYEEKEEYFDTIKKAKNFIESLTEKGMMNGKINPAAAIFNMKNNWGWKDKTEVDLGDGLKGIANLLNNADKQSKRDAIEVPEEDTGGPEVVRDQGSQEKSVGKGGGDNPSVAG